MREVEEFKRYAEACRSMARKLDNADDKRQLLEMATVWSFLASERESGLGEK